MRQSVASVAPFYLGAEDHRIFAIDFPKELIMGDGFFPCVNRQ